MLRTAANKPTRPEHSFRYAFGEAERPDSQFAKSARTKQILHARLLQFFVSREEERKNGCHPFRTKKRNESKKAKKMFKFLRQFCSKKQNLKTLEKRATNLETMNAQGIEGKA